MTAAEQALKTAETVQDAAQSRRERGLTTVVVVAQAQRQTAQARLNLTRASGDERTAYANLVAAIGLPADTHIDIADTSEQPLPAEPPENLSAVDTGGIEKSAGCHRCARQDRSRRGRGQDASAPDHYPTISLIGQVYQNMGSLSSDGSPYSSVNKPGGSILLTLSVPLFDGGARSTRDSVAQSQLAAARDKLAAVRDAAVPAGRQRV